jgi:undecaprenyl-diphosphatase
MNIIQALILGIIQGITEFLPVSSSTHLTLAKQLMGIEPNEWLIDFDLVCHFGTLFAVLTILWKDVLKILFSPRLMALFTIALIPLIPAYFLLKPLRVLLSQDVGFFLIATSLWMFLASSRYFASAPAVAYSEGNTAQTPVIEAAKWHNVLWIGVAQSLALLPGISRSGSSISMARMLGWEWKEAARFSFLLSIPTILGGSAMEIIHGYKTLASIPWSVCAIGFSASFITGMGAVRLLFWMLNRGTLRPFAWYCLIVAIIALFGIG